MYELFDDINHTKIRDRVRDTRCAIFHIIIKSRIILMGNAQFSHLGLCIWLTYRNCAQNWSKSRIKKDRNAQFCTLQYFLTLPLKNALKIHLNNGQEKVKYEFLCTFFSPGYLQSHSVFHINLSFVNMYK